MNIIEKEIENNFIVFRDKWQKEIPDSFNDLNRYSNILLTSYKKVISLNSWRQRLLQEKISIESLSFFLEAQNDALTSHILANVGLWRSALMSLRSCIENVLFCLYYKDHPIELRLWKEGKNKPNFSALLNYFKNHPDIISINDSVTGLQNIKEEYSTLSRAVHATTENFRMTAEENALSLISSEKKRLSMWQTRVTQTMMALNLLLMTIFKDYLQKSNHSDLRLAISLSIPKSKHAPIKSHLGIILIANP